MIYPDLPVQEGRTHLETTDHAPMQTEGNSLDTSAPADGEHHTCTHREDLCALGLDGLFLVQCLWVNYKYIPEISDFYCNKGFLMYNQHWNHLIRTVLFNCLNCRASGKDLICF